MKKTNNVGKVLLVTLIVSAIAAALVELSFAYFGVAETLVGAGIIAFMCLMAMFATHVDRPRRVSNWSVRDRERLWHQRELSEEAFRQKYCK